MDFKTIGTDIIKEVSRGPRQTRMGDIYHEIKTVVDKLSASHRRKRFRQFQEEEKERKIIDDKSRRKLKMTDSEESFESDERDEKLVEFAEALREQIEKDPTLAHDSSVIGNDMSNKYLMKQQMLPKEKYGDIIVPSSNIEQLIDMVKRHHKSINKEKQGKRMIREIQQIMRGTLKTFPEYIRRKQREADKEERLKNSMSNTIEATSSQRKGSLWSRTLRKGSVPDQSQNTLMSSRASPKDSTKKLFATLDPRRQRNRSINKTDIRTNKKDFSRIDANNKQS